MSFKRLCKQIFLVLILSALGSVAVSIAAPAPISLHTSVTLPVDI